ncbi:hypothetical protein [Bacillus atrophaeus]|uniref:hypothetical protein n=1 Tax=Bacillus atrophaeus TaxID=1452 RepID=UPI00077A879C|nr:hypothetical protein [Bacillus atrophaeus]KXZ12916.1 hypothetical protein AXI57_17060 [Bacillus atrophaeus]MED4809523.1 hypothetical protein [Bacillus atrophaeus]GED03056.1 hypothetical protein BAT02nite_27000 [Bacillus atrophaeus]
MVEIREFKARVYYTENIKITQTNAGIEMTEGVVQRVGGNTYPMESVSFDLTPDDSVKVAYQLYAVLDNETDEMSYVLTKTYVDGDGYYPGYNMEKRLILTLVDIVVDKDGNRAGHITNYVKSEEETKIEA